MAGSPAATAQQPEQIKTTGDRVVLNLIGSEIETVVKAMGQYLNVNFMLDPRVKGVMNLVSGQQPLDRKQVMDLLATSLRLQGYVLIKSSNGIIKVVPETDAKVQSASLSSSDNGDEVTTKIFRLNHESAGSILPILRPLIAPNNTISANATTNTLVITDYVENMRRLEAIILSMDVPVVNDYEIIPVQHAIATDLAVIVGKLLDSAAPAAGAALPGATVLSDPRTNSIILKVTSAARSKLTRTLIEKLDKPTDKAGNIHVVYLKNADAVKLAKTLRKIFAFDASALPSQKTSALSKSSMLQGDKAERDGGVKGELSDSGSNNDAAGYIQADESSNSLIITMSEPLYRNVRNVIDQLDARRAQIYVEALIVEVTDSAANEIGVQWFAANGKHAGSRIAGGTGFSGTNTGLTSGNIFNAALAQASGAAGTPGLGNGFQIGVFRQIANQIGFGALASALSSTNGGNVLSMPNLLTLDNEEAKIVVGQNVPFVTGSYATTGGTATNPFTTVERKDVGTALRIRPHVSAGGTIRFEISQEVSAVVSSTAGNPNGPTTTKRSLDTNVLVEDGQIIVLGGLISDDSDSKIQKVPFLGDLPVIGNLFKYQSGSRSKTNLMVFLRPTILKDAGSANVIVADKYDFMRKAQVDMESHRKDGLTPGISQVVPLNVEELFSRSKKSSPDPAPEQNATADAAPAPSPPGAR